MSDKSDAARYKRALGEIRDVCEAALRMENEVADVRAAASRRPMYVSITVDGHSYVYGTCRNEAVNHDPHRWGEDDAFYCNGKVL